MLKTTLVVALSLIQLTSMSDAQESNTSSNFMAAQLSEQILNQTIAFSNEKLVKAQANLLRKHYEALIEAGFNKSEAIQIIVAMASSDK
ncbi:hypothetical protein [Paraglaciecola sp.]|uniref:hypothetical protein n=1 Tax=Paraglaciecola sp. TaxID=1920173 RepID=UPI0032672275